MKKSIATLVGLAIAFSFMAAYAGTPPEGSTPPTTPPSIPVTPPLPTKTFTGAVTKIDAKLSTITVKGKTSTELFLVTNTTIIKVKGVKKTFKDLALNMVVLVTYQVKNKANIALTITTPPPQTPPPPPTGTKPPLPN